MEKISTRGQQFDQININAPDKSGFDISSTSLGSGKIGKIIPTRVKPLVPGDTIKGQESVTINFEPLSVPLMGNLYFKTEKYVVPYRVLWSKFKKFYGGKDTSLVFPSSTQSDIYKEIVSILYGKPVDKAIPFIVPIASFQKYIDLVKSNVLNWCESTPSDSYDLFYPFFDSLDKYKSDLKLYLIDILQECAQLSATNTIDITNIFMNNQFVHKFMQFIGADNGSFDSTRISDFVDIVLNDFESLGIDGLDFIYSFYINLDGTNNSLKSFWYTIYSSFPTNDTDLTRSQWLTLVSPLLLKLWNLSYILLKPTFYILDVLFGQSSLFDYMCAPKLNLIQIESYFREFIQSDFDYTYKQVLLRGSDGTAQREYFVNLCGRYTFSTLLNESSSYINQYLNFANFESLDYIPIDGFTYKCASGGDVNANQSFLLHDSFNWLPFRANYMVWYWNYRDKLLELNNIDPEDYIGDVPQPIELVVMSLMRPRAWSKDMFTTALDNTGSGNVYVPTTDVHNGENVNVNTNVGDSSGDSDISTTFALNGTLYRLPSRYLESLSPDSDTKQISSSITVDNINRARMLAKFLQKELILSNDYQDIMFSHWAQKLSDKSLQRPQWIDGQDSLVNVDAVVNNTTTTEQIAGDKTGIAFTSGVSDGYNFHIEEPMYELSYLSVMPYQCYPYGVNREYYRTNRFDMPWHEFANLGMDSVYNAEISSPVPNCVRPYDVISDVKMPNSSSKQPFGYQGRYYDFKSQTDDVHGRLLSDYKMYIFGRDFDYYHSDTTPKLNYLWIHCHFNYDMFVVNDPFADMFRYDVHHSEAVSRSLPIASTEKI